MKIRLPAYLLALLLTVSLFTLAACDGSGPDLDPSEVDGVYQFDTFTFTYQGGRETVQAFQTLARNGTQLVLSSNGRYTLSYEFQDENREGATLNRAYSGGNGEVILDSGDDSEIFTQILLPPQLELNYESGTLTAVIEEHTVNLEQFNPDRYEGLEQITGTLRLELSRQ